MTYETLDLLVDPRGVAYLTLNQPDKRNALSGQMIADLTACADELGRDPSLRVVVLSGAGKMFCAGGDLAWMKRQINADRDTRIREATKLAMMLNTLNELPKPVIGRIHGGAFGGGVGLACICDVAIAEVDAKFGLTETKLGLIPATIGPYVLARLGEGPARRVFMSGRSFGAEEAQSLGVVADCVPDADLDSRVEQEVLPYLSCAPNAVGAAKALARALGSPINQATIEDTIRRLADTWEGAETKSGIESFFAKQPPPWARPDN